MTKYRVPKLSSNTPREEQNKLLKAVKGVRGVQAAKLYLGSNELGITARQTQAPRYEDIASAVSKAGFPLAPRL